MSLTTPRAKLDSMNNRLTALERGIKDIRTSLDSGPATQFGTAAYTKLPNDKKLLALNEALVSLAKQAGITLPRS